MTPLTKVFTRVCLIAVTGGLLSACSPDTATAPQLAETQFFISSNWDNSGVSFGSPILAPGAIALNQMGYYDASVIAVSSNPKAIFPDEERIPVRVSTSAGDIEQMMLSKALCNGSICHMLTVMLHPGSNADALRHDIDSHGARIAGISRSGTTLSVYIFEPRNIPAIIAWLNLRSEVRSIVTAGVTTMQGASSPASGGDAKTGNSGVYLTGGIRVDERNAAPTQYNNHLEVLPGDTITVTITQPDNSTFSYQQVVGSWMDIVKTVELRGGN